VCRHEHDEEVRKTRLACFTETLVSQREGSISARRSEKVDKYEERIIRLNK
jgi:hypothetical protein